MSPRSILIAFVLASASMASVSADPPPYLILRAPVTPKNPHDTQGYYPGRGYGVHTEAYSYGWFGAKTGRTWQRQFGVQRNYVQWKAR